VDRVAALFNVGTFLAQEQSRLADLHLVLFALDRLLEVNDRLLGRRYLRHRLPTTKYRASQL